AAFRILATGKVLSFSRCTGVGTRRIIKKPHINFLYGPLVAAPEPSNRIWKDSP
ncbi:hypothetical protein MKW94_001008, partial [Papaver nudicaule]|nr:hypothetical protein [Papaver nudicaule]